MFDFELLYLLQFSRRRQHSGPKPFACPDCDKSFFLKHHLRRHQTEKHGRKPVKRGSVGRYGFSRDPMGVGQMWTNSSTSFGIDPGTVAGSQQGVTLPGFDSNSQQGFDTNSQQGFDANSQQGDNGVETPLEASDFTTESLQGDGSTEGLGSSQHEGGTIEQEDSQHTSTDSLSVKNEPNND